MKNLKSRLKVILVAFIIIPCLFMFSACGKKSTAENLASDLGFSSVQEMIDSFKGKDGTDGKDAPQLDTYTLWGQACENGEYNGSYLDFIKDNINISHDSTSTIANKCVMSVVTVSTRSSGGSGVIYSLNENEAYIITNYHVVYYPSSPLKAYSEYNISLYGMEDTKIKATFVGGSANYDLAVLKVSDTSVLTSHGAQPAVFANNDVKFGIECLAIGNPRPDKVEGIAVSKGIVSVDYEQVSANVGGATRYINEIRHDCYITYGSSGGGLFNLKGELIGITNGGIDSTCINYAIPAITVNNIVQNIIENCDGTVQNCKPITYDKILSSYTSISSDLEYNKTTGFIDVKQKIAITGTYSSITYASESPTIENGDTIISIKITSQNNKIIEKDITRLFHINDIFINTHKGDTVTFKLLSNGSEKTVTITLTEENKSVIS